MRADASFILGIVPLLAAGTSGLACSQAPPASAQRHHHGILSRLAWLLTRLFPHRVFHLVSCSLPSVPVRRVRATTSVMIPPEHSGRRHHQPPCRPCLSATERTSKQADAEPTRRFLREVMPFLCLHRVLISLPPSVPVATPRVIAPSSLDCVAERARRSSRQAVPCSRRRGMVRWRCGSSRGICRCAARLAHMYPLLCLR